MSGEADPFLSGHSVSWLDGFDGQRERSAVDPSEDPHPASRPTCAVCLRRPRLSPVGRSTSLSSKKDQSERVFSSILVVNSLRPAASPLVKIRKQSPVYLATIDAAKPTTLKAVRQKQQDKTTSLSKGVAIPVAEPQRPFRWPSSEMELAALLNVSSISLSRCR